MTARAVLLVACWALASVAGAADTAVEIIELRNRPASEMIPIIEPLAGPGASITGTGYTLFVRADPGYMDEVRRVIARLDTRPRNLLITVRQVNSARAAEGALGAGGEVVIGGDSQVSVEARRTTTRDRDDNSYRVRTLEGREAFIRVGQRVPYRSREFYTQGRHNSYGANIDYQLVASGFYVVPHLQGDRVQLEVSPSQQRLARDGSGRIATREVQTVVAGRLGEWIDLGAATDDAAGDGRDIAKKTTRTSRDDYVTQVRVELLP